MMVAMFIFWLIWGLGGGAFILNYLCNGADSCKKVEMLGAVGDIFGGVNALFAGLALGAVAIGTDQARRSFLAERQWSRDEKFAEQIQKSLQWAYDVLTDGGSSIPPTADRLKWLTCARHLLRAQKLMKQVKTQEWITIVEDHEEFWRHKFNLAMGSLNLRDWRYFANSAGNAIIRENIEITSAMVVVDFGNWRKGRSDITDEVSREELIANGNPYSGSAGRGLQAYVNVLQRERMERVGVGHVNDGKNEAPVANTEVQKT